MMHVDRNDFDNVISRKQPTDQRHFEFVEFDQ